MQVAFARLRLHHFGFIARKLAICKVGLASEMDELSSSRRSGDFIDKINFLPCRHVGFVIQPWQVERFLKIA